jgi:signal transduction histidine kinase
MRRLNELGRRLQQAPLLIDAMLVIGLSVLAVVEMLQYGAPGFRAPDALSGALTALAVVPMLLRHRRPDLSLGAVLASGVTLALSGYAVGNLLIFGIMIALFSVAVRSSHGRSLPALAAATLGLVTILVASSRQLGEPPPLTDLALVAIPATAWGMGAAHRRLRENAQTLRVLTSRLRDERASSERRAVLEERHRIARELHDVVAHHISAIAMQANAARARPSTHPDQADENLAFIYTASRDALTEMRRLIGILKGAETDDLRAPRPTLADLEKLVAHANEADLATELEIRGTPRPLPAMLELSAYRIVQEALTNAIKHASPAKAQVLVHHRPDRLYLAVTDTGRHQVSPDRAAPTRGSAQASAPDTAQPPPLPSGGDGFGLVGMRERVALFGGVLQTGPGPEGGFRVVATLPVPGSPP